jgi:hypothetical protein
MMPSVRTTVTLDPEVAKKLKALAHRNQTSFKVTLNDVLRRGLAAQAGRTRTPFLVKPHAGGFVPGIDLAKLNQLSDELECEDFVEEARRTAQQP